MSAAKKAPTAKSAGSKKSAPRAPAAHPPWIDMIKECIAAHPEDARHGVSRPQIKKYVEEKYGLELGAAQITQLSKAINHGAEKGIFVLPKGPSGRVKLPPKSQRPADASATKENKPDAKPVKAKAPAKSTTAAKTAAAKKATTAKKPAAAKPTAPRKAVPAKSAAKSTTTAKAKAAPTAKKAAPAAKKAPAKKPAAAAAAKKTTTTSKRDSAKKAAMGRAPAAKKATSRPTKVSTRTTKARRP
ncbi:hypothetical protein BD414DRAFT_476739 [Trametes punicea]|nr:hypothetical protein BD414DRAFT_476739 [Trametes punicea]